MTEGKTVELKREYTENIKKTVIAFANTDGGTVYIGIEDDGTIVGIEDADDTILRMGNAIRDAIRPDITLFTECSIELIEEKKVVKVLVQQGTARPYYIGKKGLRAEGVYVRQGASTVPATESTILKMIKETSGDCYETARSLEQNLTFEETTKCFQKRAISFEELQKTTLQLIGKDGTYTNLGLLLSEECTHTIKLAVFQGSKKTVFKERREFTGSVISQVEKVYEYLDKYNQTKAEFYGLERIDSKDYPEEALREALLNAVVHRDYSFSGSILINIFDDRVEFVTIGGLVKGMTLDDIMLGLSILRNQNLANIFYRLNLIEAYGTGIPKIMNAYEGLLVKPTLMVTDNAFKIILPNKNTNVICDQIESNIGHIRETNEYKLNKEEQKILSIFNTKMFIVRKDVEDILEVSQATAVVILREMRRKGLIERIGNGKKIRYGRL